LNKLFGDPRGNLVNHETWFNFCQIVGTDAGKELAVVIYGLIGLRGDMDGRSLPTLPLPPVKNNRILILPDRNGNLKRR
jgi:hypothetical protein